MTDDTLPNAPWTLPAPPVAVAPADRPWDALSGLPRTLWLPATINSAGTAEARLPGVRRWLLALHDGALPDTGWDFDDAPALEPLRAVVGELALPVLCRGVPALCEQVLRTLLWHLDRVIDRPPAQSRDEAIAHAAQGFREEWTRERADWDQALGLLRDLGEFGDLRWDELRGRLQAREWQEAQRIRALLARMPALVALIQRIGREEERADAADATQDTPAAQSPPRQAALRPRVTELPDAPGEVHGIRRSGQIAAMLPAEAAQLRQPVLRKLWRARVVEQSLLTIQQRATSVDWVPAADPRVLRAAPQQAPRARGPMIVCLDTSGSMRGAPENVAKAVVMQALRTATLQQRRCLLIAFGGPDEVIERELTSGHDGLMALLDVMGQAFDGGTDVATPLERAVDRVRQAGWSRADVLLASDGEFGLTPDALTRLEAANRDLGLRVYGVLIGDRETMGMLEVCDELFWVRDWRRWATHPDDAYPDGFSPVHSRSLTALYFPNALSERAKRHRGGG